MLSRQKLLTTGRNKIGSLLKIQEVGMLPVSLCAPSTTSTLAFSSFFVSSYYGASEVEKFLELAKSLGIKDPKEAKKKKKKSTPRGTPAALLSHPRTPRETMTALLSYRPRALTVKSAMENMKADLKKKGFDV